MAYFVVVHHRRAEQQWTNNWLDDDRLGLISTTAEVASRCELERTQGARIYVHRCGWHGAPPLICCSVRVEKASHDMQVGWVKFSDAKLVGVTPAFHPAKGQNSYDGDEPPSGQR